MALWPLAANAHVSGYTDSSVQISASGVRVIFTTPRDNLVELQRSGASASGKGPVETAGPPSQYERAVLAGWQVSAGGQRCLLSQTGATALQRVDAYQFQITWVCPQGLDDVAIGYTLLFDRWAEHENYARVFVADQRLRMRFTAEHRVLSVPVAKLLGQWKQQLAPGFFDSDPNHDLSSGGEARDTAMPRIAEPRPSLGTLRWAQLDPGFVRLGLVHIAQGLDHVLFVVGLVMVATGWRSLLLLITAFTLAHTVTLALATLGAIRIDAAIAEPLIAATIIYIGVENLLAQRAARARARSGVAAAAAAPGRLDAALLRRAGLVFLFGLVHGIGFSDALREMGLREDVLGPLLMFNLGVELAQLAIIAAVLPLVTVLRRFAWGAGVTAGVSAAVALSGVVMMAGRL